MVSGQLSSGCPDVTAKPDVDPSLPNGPDSEGGGWEAMVIFPAPMGDWRPEIFQVSKEIPGLWVQILNLRVLLLQGALCCGSPALRSYQARPHFPAVRGSPVGRAGGHRGRRLALHVVLPWPGVGAPRRGRRLSTAIPRARS